MIIRGLPSSDLVLQRGLVGRRRMFFGEKVEVGQDGLHFVKRQVDKGGR
jgi:hypothetical protein